MQRARPKTSTGLIFLENFDYQSLFLAILFSFDLESKTFSLYSCESQKKGMKEANLAVVSSTTSVKDQMIRRRKKELLLSKE